MKAKNAQKLVTIITIVLALLLALSLALLAWALHTRNKASAAVTTPSNVISPEKELLSYSVNAGAVPLTGRIAVDRAESGDTVLELYRSHADESTPFRVGNMFPGDTEHRTERLRVSYTGQITVHFHADIQPGYEKLAEVLGRRVTVGGDVLYDGLMRDMPASIDCRLPQSSGGAAELTYEIDAYLATSVGNDYMEKTLKANLVWWVDASEGGTDHPSGQDRPSRPDGTTPGTSGGSGTSDEPAGELIPSQKTGDNSHIWLMVGILALALFMLLLLTWKRKKEARNENKA